MTLDKKDNILTQSMGQPFMNDQLGKFINMQIFIIGFIFIIILGSVILSLQVSNADGNAHFYLNKQETKLF